MSLIIKDGDSLQYRPILDRFNENKWEVSSLDSMPQQVRDCTAQAKINVYENPHFYSVNSDLLGVELKNIWICIEGKTLYLYAGVTGEKQENGEYRYTKELLGGIRGEIKLPERVHPRPARPEFHRGSVVLFFPKKANGDLYQTFITN
jgi:HSP20 family molecular chaperone IbpA